MIEFPRPELPSRVAETVFNSSKLHVVEWMGPKSFRVEAGLAWLTERAFEGNQDQEFWWIGPDYGSGASANALLRSALTSGSYTVPGRSLSLTLINGATISFKNAELPNTLHSDRCMAAIIDRAVDIPERSWLAIRDTIATTLAPARIISTVAGKDNWFNELARRAEAAEDNSIGYSRFSCLDAIEEELLTQADIDYARATLPDHSFRALYLAQPYDDRVESAHRARDPKLLTDAELAIIAGLDPTTLNDESSIAFLKALVESGIRNASNSVSNSY